MESDSVIIKGGNSQVVQQILLGIAAAATILSAAYDVMSSEENIADFFEKEEDEDSIKGLQSTNIAKQIQIQPNESTKENLPDTSSKISSNKELLNTSSKIPNKEELQLVLSKLQNINKMHEERKAQKLDNRLFGYVDKLIETYRQQYNVLDTALKSEVDTLKTEQQRYRTKLDSDKSAAKQAEEKKLEQQNTTYNRGSYYLSSYKQSNFSDVEKKLVEEYNTNINKLQEQHKLSINTVISKSEYISTHFQLVYVRGLLEKIEVTYSKSNKQYLSYLLKNIQKLIQCIDIIMSVLVEQLSEYADINTFEDKLNKTLFNSRKLAVDEKYNEYTNYLKNIIEFSDELLNLYKGLLNSEQDSLNIDSAAFKEALINLGIDDDIKIDADLLKIFDELKKNIETILIRLPCSDPDNIEPNIKSWLNSSVGRTFSSLPIDKADLTSTTSPLSLSSTKETDVLPAPPLETSPQAPKTSLSSTLGSPSTSESSTLGAPSTSELGTSPTGLETTLQPVEPITTVSTSKEPSTSGLEASLTESETLLEERSYLDSFNEQVKQKAEEKIATRNKITKDIKKK